MVRSVVAYARAFLLACIPAVLFTTCPLPAAADFILVSGFFSGGIDIYSPASGTTQPFATVASQSDPFPGLSGLAYSPLASRIYATARVSNRIYAIDGNGTVSVAKQLATGSNAPSPAGIVVDASGNVYVANNGLNTVSRFDPTFTTENTITLPNAGGSTPNNPSGLAFDNSGNLLISTFGGTGVLRYLVDSGSFAPEPFNVNPGAANQIAVASSGTTYVGMAAYSSDVLRLLPDGTTAGTIPIDASLLPPPPQPFTSFPSTNPSGVAIDAAGNIIVAAMGRTNPTSASDNRQSNGGVFRFDPAGTILLDSAVQTTPYSAVLVAPVPEPSTIALGGLGLAALAAAARRRRRSPRSP